MFALWYGVESFFVLFGFQTAWWRKMETRKSMKVERKVVTLMYIDFCLMVASNMDWVRKLMIHHPAELNHFEDNICINLFGYQKRKQK